MNYIREAITQQHIGEEAIALRRHLHAHPDLSEQEFPTMELVCEHLDAAGIPYKRNVAESGVVGLIKGAFPGPVIALRRTWMRFRYRKIIRTRHIARRQRV